MLPKKRPRPPVCLSPARLLASKVMGGLFAPAAASASASTSPIQT